MRLQTLNICFSSCPSKYSLWVDEILLHPPDAICIQEACPELDPYLDMLDDLYHISPLPDLERPYYQLILVLKVHGTPLFKRIPIPSVQHRDFVMTTLPFARIICVHLESLPNQNQIKYKQMNILTHYINDDDHIIIMGDFNVYTEMDEGKLSLSGLHDACVHLGATFGSSSRLDRVYLGSAFSIERVGFCHLGVSDHKGLEVEVSTMED